MIVHSSRFRFVEAIGAAGVLIGFVCVVTARVAGQQAASQMPTTGTSAMSGVVTDAATGAPVAGARVTIVNVRDAAGQIQPFQRPSAQTDARGRFVFVDLPSTLWYEVWASHQGHNIGEANGGVSTKLAEGEWKRDLTIVMPRATAVSGRVTDERGEPVVGTAVRLFTRRMAAGHEIVLGSSTASTDDRGVYRMTFVEPGRYYVAVLSVQATAPATVVDGERVLPLGGLQGRGAPPPTATVATARGASIDADGRHRLVLTSFATPPSAGGGGSVARAYPPVFYPNARTVAEAQFVEVPANGSVTNIDIQLTPVATSTVSGRISGATENAANMVLRLMPPGGEHLGFGSEVATSVVEPDGSFTFLNVPRGEYTLITGSVVAEISAGQSGPGRPLPSAGYGATSGFSMQYPSVPNTNFLWWQTRGGSTAWGRTPVTVAADLTNLDFPLHETTSVRGRLVVDDPSQLRSGDQLEVTLEPANADPSLGAFVGSTTGDAHEFSITGLRAGRYVLRIQPAFREWRITSAVASGVDLVDAGVDGAAGQNVDGLVLSVTRTGALLSGTVHDRSGAPAPAAVILFPVDSKAWTDYGLTPDRVRSVNTDSTGHYRLPPLRDGDYFAIAVPVSQSKAWIDPRFLAAASGQATRVSLSSAAAKTLALAVAQVVVR